MTSFYSYASHYTKPGIKKIQSTYTKVSPPRNKIETKKRNNKTRSKGEYVLVIYEHDVLLGRGSGPNDHDGNIRFREMVAKRKTEYLSTNNRRVKVRVAEEIVGTVYSRGGRFLKKLDEKEAIKKLPSLLLNSHIENKSMYDSSGEPRGVYQVQNHKIVMEKAKQALRQMTGRGRYRGPLECISPLRPADFGLPEAVRTSLAFNPPTTSWKNNAPLSSLNSGVGTMAQKSFNNLSALNFPSTVSRLLHPNLSNVTTKKRLKTNQVRDSDINNGIGNNNMSIVPKSLFFSTMILPEQQLPLQNPTDPKEPPVGIVHDSLVWQEVIDSMSTVQEQNRISPIMEMGDGESLVEHPVETNRN